MHLAAPPLEDLADAFDRMAARLGESYATLEHTASPIGVAQATYARDILDAGRHQLALINDALDISKVEAGRIDLEPSTVSVSRAVDDAIGLVRAAAAQRRINVWQEVDPAVGDIEADPRKLRQILVNLLSNAVKFTPESGLVVVSGARANGHVEISVSDTGAGIAPDEMDVIFQEFGRTSAANGREGTGLGLALTKRLVELHGGRISVQSQPGEGSTFTVELPVGTSSAG